MLSGQDDPVLETRLRAQLLSGPPARGPVEVCAHLLAVQAQDPRGARLAVRARSKGLTAAAVDHALTEDRSLLITWVNRGTLHLIRREDYPWLHALTTPPLRTGNLKRLEQEGVTPAAAARGVATIERALADEGPLTRAALRDRVDAAGVPTARQALVHILFLATLQGHIVRGPMVGGEQAFVLTRDWLGPPEPVDRGAALAELARRYLRGHGPASDRDLARWAGLPLRDARAGLSAIAGELTERPGGLVGLTGRRTARRPPPPKLLGPFDPALLGWSSREDILGAHTELVTMNGIFKAFAMVDGRAAGTWGMPRGNVEIQPFGPLDPAVTRALDAEARDVERYLAAGQPSGA
jgi:Winged helix DNA-binding domain